MAEQSVDRFMIFEGLKVWSKKDHE